LLKVLIMTSNAILENSSAVATNSNAPVSGAAIVQQQTSARTHHIQAPKKHVQTEPQKHQDHRDQHTHGCLGCMENDFKKLEAERILWGVLSSAGSNSSMDLNSRLINLHKEKDKASLERDKDSLERDAFSRLVQQKMRTKLQESKKRIRDLEQEVNVRNAEIQAMKLRDIDLAEFMHGCLDKLEDVRSGEKRPRSGDNQDL